MLEEPETPTLEQEILKHITRARKAQGGDARACDKAKAQQDAEMLTITTVRSAEEFHWQLPHLSFAADREGLQHMRVNLANDIDL